MRNYLLLAAIVLVCVVPFSSRAVYLDEHIYLLLARSAHTNWMFPQDTPELFFGIRYPNFAPHTHPPVGEYFLALLYSLLGRFREVPFRLAFSVFPIAAVLGFGGIAGFAVEMQGRGIAVVTFDEPERLNGMTQALKRDQGIAISGIVMVSPLLEGHFTFGGTGSGLSRLGRENRDQPQIFCASVFETITTGRRS